MLNYVYAVMFQTSRQDSSHSVYVSVGLVLTLWPKQALPGPPARGFMSLLQGCAPQVCAQGALFPALLLQEKPVTVPRVTRADHRHFRDTFLRLTWVPPCFPGLEPEGNSLRLTSAVSGVRNLGVFFIQQLKLGAGWWGSWEWCCELDKLGVSLEWDWVFLNPWVAFSFKSKGPLLELL